MLNHEVFEVALSPYVEVNALIRDRTDMPLNPLITLNIMHIIEGTQTHRPRRQLNSLIILDALDGFECTCVLVRHEYHHCACLYVVVH